jgi:ferredoxin/nitroreductase
MLLPVKIFSSVYKGHLSSRKPGRLCRGRGGEEMTRIAIDESLCSGCRRCQEVCPSALYAVEEKKARVKGDGARDCILCGQCIAACPDGAVSIEGLAATSFAPLGERGDTLAGLTMLLEERRSVRAYRKDDVPEELVRRALELGAMSPVSLPPWMVEVTVVLGRERIAPLADVIAASMAEMLGMERSLVGRFFMRRAIGAPRYGFMKRVFFPLIDGGLRLREREGLDVILRDAPGLAVFHSRPEALEPATDCVLAAAHTALAMQALGLGVCFNGLVTGAAEMNKRLHAALGIPERNGVHAALTFGFPKVRYGSSIRRPFAAVVFR